MTTGVQLATKGIIPKNNVSHGISIATMGYISYQEEEIVGREIDLDSVIDLDLVLESNIPGAVSFSSKIPPSPREISLESTYDFIGD